MFKFQHDTDKDLKFVHVFPKLDAEAAKAATAAEGGAAEASLGHEELLLYSELPIFQRMVESKTPSFSQRRRVLELLKEVKARHGRVEQKLAALEPLEEDEQRLYDTLDTEQLGEKLTLLTRQLDAMITGGKLTKGEQQLVRAQLASKLEAIEMEAATAEEAGKAKRAEKLRAGADEVRKRFEAVRSAPPYVRKPKFEAEIKAAKKKLAELEKIEKSNTVLPLAEVQKLSLKPKLLADLSAMQAERDGWFAGACE